MDLTMLLHAFYLFIELLGAKCFFLYMSFYAIYCMQRRKHMVMAQILKNHLDFLKQFSYE